MRVQRGEHLPTYLLTLPKGQVGRVFSCAGGGNWPSQTECLAQGTTAPSAGLEPVWLLGCYSQPRAVPAGWEPVHPSPCALCVSLSSCQLSQALHGYDPGPEGVKISPCPASCPQNNRPFCVASMVTRRVFCYIPRAPGAAHAFRVTCACSSLALHAHDMWEI